MLEATLRAAVLAVLLLFVAWLPGWVLALGVLALLGWGLLGANRTRPTRLAGRSVLVTGASSGLGRAIAKEAAARRAARVFLVSRSADKLELVADEIRSTCPWCTPIVLPCDLYDADAVAAVAAALVAEHGPPDVVVNNAGAGAWQHIEEGTADEARAHITVPYLGAVWLTQALVPAMIARGSGHVLNVTSAASLAGFRAANTYGAARWAMRGFSQYLRADLAGVGIGVTLINAAEITGTAYFAEGNAGEQSHQRIPWLFQLPVVEMLNGRTEEVAAAAMSGVEKGTHEVLYPRSLVIPTRLVIDLFPEVLHHALRIGPNGRR